LAGSERHNEEPAVNVGAGPATRVRSGWFNRLRERGVLRVAASYGVIAWLALQIASVVLDPLGLPKWVMTALIIAAAAGFPLAVALAWFLEVGQHGIERDEAADGAARPAARGVRHYADVIVIGVLVVAVAVLLVRQSDLGKPKPPESPAIAVLPFANLSGDPEQEYFSDGLAEEMLDRLGRVPGLKVIARSSSFGFKGRDVDAKDVAERLGVTTVLEGSVRRDGQRLKLNARLIDGASGQQVWSGSFDREVTDIFVVQAELAGAIVNAIVPTARGEAIDVATPPTTDLKAYDLYLLARTQLAMRTPESIPKSVELMEQALALDPDFARAHAHLAASLLFRRMYYSNSADEDTLIGRAETSIHRALALDPNLSEAYDAQGNLLRDTNRPGAEEAYERAIELNPNNATAWHDYAVFLSNSAQRHDESNKAMMRSLELDPRQPVTWANYLIYVLRTQGRERFEAEYARAMRTVGDMPGATFRFPQPIWADDRAGFKNELGKLIDKARGDAGVLDSLTLPNAAIAGFPVECFKAGLAKPQSESEVALPTWINYSVAWLVVDPQRAASYVPAHLGENFKDVRVRVDVQVAGLQGDWPRLDRALRQMRTEMGEDNRRVQSIIAFWGSVRGHYADAAQALALAEPIPETEPPPGLGGDTHWGLMETAQARIYRGTGRAEMARRFASERLDQLREEWRAADTECDWVGWMQAPMRYASLAANEGLKEEAVRALHAAMRCGELPYGFFPQLPWFRSLEGYAPYDELLRERARRIERIRAELLQLEANSNSVVRRQ
jgi:adenylate cyclase